MSILSIPVPEQLEQELELFQKERHFGRSEIIRTALRAFFSEQESHRKLTGIVNAVLLVIHSAKGHTFSELQHKHEALIHTQLHNHLENGKCLELLVLRGEGKKIHSMVEELQASGKLDVVKLVVA